MPEWRNWQTHTTQNRAGNHVGSSPTLGTNKVSVRTPSNRIDTNIIQKWMVFFAKKLFYLVFNYSNNVYISKLTKNIKLPKLEEYFKKHIKL